MRTLSLSVLVLVAAACSGADTPGSSAALVVPEVPVSGAGFSAAPPPARPKNKTNFFPWAAGLAVLAVLLIVAGAIPLQAFFQVDESQLALITRFGEPRKVITLPGRYTKMPLIDAVTYFDRSFDVDVPSGFSMTSDRKRMIMDSRLRCTVVDPLLFYRTVRTTAQAKSRIADIMASELRIEVTKYSYAEIMQATDGAVTTRVRASAAPKLEQFGIEITDMAINVTPIRP